MGASGQYTTFSPGPNPNLDIEHELQRWLAVHPLADAPAGFRAGWSRLARFVRPKLRDWETRWWGAMRENEPSEIDDWELATRNSAPDRQRVASAFLPAPGRLSRAVRLPAAPQ